MNKKSPTTQQLRTVKARTARWEGTVESRWENRRDKIILFIAKLGWSTRELTNFSLGLTGQTWPKKMEEQGFVYRQKIILADATISRKSSTGAVTTILLLSDAGHKRAQLLDGKFGKRVGRPSLPQARHDLISFWAAVFCMRERTDLMQRQDSLSIWSDQVLRGLNKYAFRGRYIDAEFRPDATIICSKTYEPIINVEVERSRKKSGLEEYIFLRKLEAYAKDEGLETLIVTESKARTENILSLIANAKNQGIPAYYFNPTAKTWLPVKDGIEKFKTRVTVGQWDHEKKAFLEAFYWGDKPKPKIQPEESDQEIGYLSLDDIEKMRPRKEKPI